MLILFLAVRGYFLQEPRLLTYRPLKLTRKVSFVFPMKVSEEISPLSFHKLLIYIMHLKYDKSERNSSDHHMTYIALVKQIIEIKEVCYHYHWMCFNIDNQLIFVLCRLIYFFLKKIISS